MNKNREQKLKERFEQKEYFGDTHGYTRLDKKRMKELKMEQEDKQ